VSTVTEILYLIATALFILALRWMSQPDTARRAGSIVFAETLIRRAEAAPDPELPSDPACG